MKRVILHIGQHKTGTTYIQKKLLSYENKLKKHGILYLDKWRERGNGHLPIIYQLKTKDVKPNLTSYLEEQFKQYHTIIISSENFENQLSQDDIIYLKSFFKKEWEIEIIYYARNPVTLLFSRYQEGIKWGGHVSLECFLLNEIYKPLKSQYINFTVNLTPFINVFGKDKIKVLLYDKTIMHENLFESFLKNILGLYEFKIDYDRKLINKSYTVEDVEIIRNLNCIHTELTNQKSQDQIRKKFINNYNNLQNDINKCYEYLKKVNKRCFILDNNNFIFNRIEKYIYNNFKDIVLNAEPDKLWKRKIVKIPIFDHELYSESHNEFNDRIRTIYNKLTKNKYSLHKKNEKLQNIKSKPKRSNFNYLYKKYKKIKPRIPRFLFWLAKPLFLLYNNLKESKNHNTASDDYVIFKEKTNKSKLTEDIPLISVIIPSRVGEKIETLPYLENQTYKNLEIIIEYDYRREGVSIIRNKGAKKASGKYLFFCDNDIKLSPDALENLYLTTKKNKTKWAFGKFKINGECIYNKNKDLQIPEDQKSPAFIEWFRGISTMSLVDKSINPVFDVNMKRFNDWDLWLTIYKKGYEPAFCNKILFDTISRPKGISRGSEQDRKKWENKLYKKHGIVFIA